MTLFIIQNTHYSNSKGRGGGLTSFQTLSILFICDSIRNNISTPYSQSAILKDGKGF